MIRYFISDLHLSNKRLDLIQAFVRLCKHLSEQNEESELYILGDFYDAWIGDDFQADWNHTIESSLASMNKVTLYFVHGNRDFLIGNNWCERVNATLLPELSVIEQDSIPIMLCHGDEYCTDDHSYQTFRTMVRSSQWQQQILSLPIAQRLELAAKLRADSQTSATEKSMEIMDVNPTAISNAMQANSCRHLIHGHTHRPDIHEDKHCRIVLGDWDKNIWLAKLEENQFHQYCAKVNRFIESGADALNLHHSLSLT